MKKFLFLIILTLLLLASCSGADGVEDKAFSETVELNINDDGKADFFFLRAEKADLDLDQAISGLAKSFRQNEGADRINVYDDTRKENPDATEILIGNTNRSASAAAISGLRDGEYTVGVYEGKLVMAGYDDEATLDAVNYFYRHYSDFIKDGKVTADSNYTYTYGYEYDGIKIGKNDISAYTIVYPDPGGSYSEKESAEKYAARRLNEKISQLCGITLPLENEASTEAQYRINLITDGDDYSYSVKADGKNIDIKADRVYSYTCAFDALLSCEAKDGVINIPKNFEAGDKNTLRFGESDEFVYVNYLDATVEAKEPPVSSVKIADNDLSKYQIVYHDYGKGYLDYGMNEIYAAEEMQLYLKMATGIELPVVKDSEADAAEYEILIGDTDRLDVDTSAFGDEGFVIKTEGNDLVIAGGFTRGTLYGVYTFLENYIGYGFYSEDCEVCYKADEVVIPQGLFDQQISDMEFRDTCQQVMHVAPYAAKRKINSSFYRSMNYYMGANYDFAGRSYVHTMGTTFALGDTGRQPCLSDEAVFEKTIEKARQLMRITPRAKAISITQNDNNNCCTCQECTLVNNEEGSKAGTLVRFINRVAEVFAEEYPDTKVLTFAYMYSYAAPKTAPLDNVIIEICCLDACCNHGLGDLSCSTNAEFRQNIKDWAALTDNIYVWYYSVAFTGDAVYAPFMNFEGIYDSYALFRSYGVKGVFNEGWMKDKTSEFGDLRAYLLSKLMWDPDMTKAEYDREIKRFIAAYYGEAAAVVEEYFYMMQDFAADRHFEQYTGLSGMLDMTKYGTVIGEVSDWWREIGMLEFSREATDSHIQDLERGFDKVKEFVMRNA